MSNKKTNILSTLSSFNTLLNDFPSLLTIDFNNSDDDSSSATISFLLDLSNLFGMTEKKLLDWISSILVDDEENPTRKGILSVIEESVKAAILLHFTSLYNCQIPPIIPDEFLKYSYTNLTDSELKDGNGIMVRLQSIDMFNQLKFFPLGETGQMFYFDIKSESVAQPRYLYRSYDFNAWLWWIINYSTDSNFKQFPWDNRVLYKSNFKGEDGDSNRVNFVDYHAKDSQLYNVSRIGFKKHILSANYHEEGTTLENSNVLYVYGCAETYKRTGIGGINKTVFDFNSDYIYSLKLFDTKTLIAQIINAVCGLAGAMFGQISLELNVLIKKIEKTVEIVVEKPLKRNDRGYFEFSDEEYNDIVNDATIRYNGKYETHNENNDIVTLNVEELKNAIRKIDEADTIGDKEEAISYSLKVLGGTTTEFNAGINTPFVAQKNIIMKFIKELITQISLQVLSPKVMLLFAINDYFLNGEGNSAKIDIEGFMKNFWNIISSCVIKVSSIILESLWDLVLGFIKPILALVVEKLLLETLMYYKNLLIQLLAACVPLLSISFNSDRKNLVIDNVNYADIIPSKTEPDT